MFREVSGMPIQRQLSPCPRVPAIGQMADFSLLNS
jgi:hypothetical protein